MKVLVSGAAGFIGFNLCRFLLENGYKVVGLDSLNSYYDVRLKLDRLSELGISEGEVLKNSFTSSSKYPAFNFLKGQIEDSNLLEEMFLSEAFDVVINLAAQAGVRYSIENPSAYIQSNIVGFLNILEACRNHNTTKLIYASSSSVYGLNTKMPLSPHDPTNHPMSLYAATKKSNELMAHAYSQLYGLSTVGLRFFTVYGPWGRPDMALFLFTKAIQEGKPINVYNNGNMVRDFTYIDDIVVSIEKLLNKDVVSDVTWDSDRPDPSSSSCPFRVFNIGNSNPILLNDYIIAIEDCLGKKAIRNYLPMQPGDVAVTNACMRDMSEFINFKPSVDFKDGVKEFVKWFQSYYK